MSEPKKHPRRRTRRGKKKKAPAVAPLVLPLAPPTPLSTVRARLHSLSQRRAPVHADPIR